MGERGNEGEKTKGLSGSFSDVAQAEEDREMLRTRGKDHNIIIVSGDLPCTTEAHITSRLVGVSILV